MAVFEQERPCIHVTLLPGTDPSLYRWVQIGAEEEGVPCKLVTEEGADLVALAYAAAQSSRFNIGVAVSDATAVLHEVHMPPQMPVLEFTHSDQADYFCRLIGSNAARMIVRKPLRFADEPAPFNNRSNGSESVDAAAYLPMASPPAAPEVQINPSNLNVDPVEVARLVSVIIRKLEERGIR
jgi:hypothetical protein